MTRRTAYMLGALLIWAVPLAAHAALKTLDGTPAEFAALETPQPTVLTVQYGGETLGQFHAMMRPGWVRFTRPETLIKGLPPVKDTADLTGALGGELATHTHLACRSQQAKTCPVLKPKIAGLIVDEQRLHAELFIHPDYLGISDTNGNRHLALPERKLSTLMGINGAIAGTDEGNATFALGNTLIHAYGEGRFTTRTTLTQEGFRFDTAKATVERNGMEANLGLFRSRGLQLAQDRDMAGVSYSTSQRTRLDSHKTMGNDIVVFLPRRSIVSLIREGRIYSSRAYEAGNQQLDTHELPTGAYTVTLQIQEIGGAMRTEERFYAKSPEIPAEGDPEYYVQAGVIRNAATNDDTFPRLTGDPLLQAGSLVRIADGTALSLDAIALEDRLATEIGGFTLHEKGQLQASALVTTKQDIGIQLSALHMEENWSASADLRRLWQGANETRFQNSLITELEQATGTLLWRFRPTVTLGLRGTYSAQQNISRYAIGPSLDWYLWQQGGDALSLEADAAETDQGVVASLFARLRLRFGEFGYTGHAGMRHESGDSYLSSNHRGWYEQITPDHSLLLGGGVEQLDNSRNVNADADYASDMGRLRASVQKDFGNSTLLSYGGNFLFNVVQTGDIVDFGGRDIDMSAVVISVDGDATTPLNVLVNGQDKGTIWPGSRKTVYLAPYESYRISLVNKENALIKLNSGSKYVTLYPGNVRHLEWQAQNAYVIVAKLVNTKGEPLAGALLQEGEQQTFTTDSGRLQSEITRPRRLTFITRDDNACEVQLPEGKVKNGVLIYPKPLTCQPIANVSVS